VGVPLFFVLIILCIILVYKLLQIEKQDKNPPPYRRFGWQLPWDAWQIVVTVSFFYCQFAFWALLSPGFTSSTWGAIGGSFAVLTVVVVIFWFYIVFTDPASNSGRCDSDPGPDAVKVFCVQCDAYFVGSGPGTSSKRKHCGFCKRCVIGYDHHCWFLNTCIGSWNYVAFFVLSAAYLLMLVLQAAAGAMALSVYYDESDGLGMDYSTLDDWVDDTFSSWVWQLFLYIAQVAAVFEALATLALLSFHIFLCARSMSTFTWMGMEYPDEIGGGDASQLSAINNKARVPHASSLATRSSENPSAAPGIELAEAEDDGKWDAVLDKDDVDDDGMQEVDLGEASVHIEVNGMTN